MKLLTHEVLTDLAISLAVSCSVALFTMLGLATCTCTRFTMDIVVTYKLLRLVDSQ